MHDAINGKLKLISKFPQLVLLREGEKYGIMKFIYDSDVKWQSMNEKNETVTEHIANWKIEWLFCWFFNLINILPLHRIAFINLTI